MRIPTLLSRTGLAAAATCLALAAAPVQAQGMMNLLNSLGGSGNSGSGAAGLLGAVVGGPANNGAQGEDLISLLSRSVDNIDEPREIEIGRQLAAVLLGSKPLHPDMQLQRYVNQLGRWISLQSERPHLPWTFIVLNDNGYNAFAAPGGYVFVTKGLIDRYPAPQVIWVRFAGQLTLVLLILRHRLAPIRHPALGSRPCP